MPIINAEIAETINITGNGQYDVARYSLANIQVDGLTRYVNKNGTLVANDSTLIGGEFGNATILGDNALYYAYYKLDSLKGIVDLSNIISITGSQAGYHAFYQCTGLTSVDLSSLDNVTGESACYYMFYGCTGLTSINLSSLTTISGNYGCQYMFYGCTGLTNVDLSSLTEINAKYACQYMFRDCTGITSVDLSALTTVGGQNACQYMFRGCTSLKRLLFPSLSTVLGDPFSNMLTGCSDVLVVFPAALESTITSLSSYNNGFGGTNTEILFGNVKTLPVTIPNGWSVIYNGNPLNNGETWITGVGTKHLVVVSDISLGNHYGYVQFEVTDETTEFVFDPQSVQFTKITLQSTVNDTDFYFKDLIIGNGSDFSYRIGEGYINGNELYTNAVAQGYVYGVKEGYLSYDYYFDAVEPLSITISMQVPTVQTFSAADLLNNMNITSGYEDKFSVDNEQLVVHTTSTTAQHFSGGITLPAGINIVQISGTGLVSSEANYDYGYVYLDSNQVDFTASQIKGNYSDNLLFKQAGTDNTWLQFNKRYKVSEQQTITIGWAQDATIKGDNTMWLLPITIKYI